MELLSRGLALPPPYAALHQRAERLLEAAGSTLPPLDAGVEAAERTRAASVGLVAGLALVGVTLVLHLVVGPTTEESLVSLLVWLPGAAGLLSVVFGHAPSLVELARYRSTVIEPARAFAAPAAANATEDPDGST